MSVTLRVKCLDPHTAALLAAYAGPVTRVAGVVKDPALSASDLVRSGAPYAGAWKAERSAARKARRALRKARAEAKALAGF